MTTYWEQATQEERLAQIDGGLEVGMTSRQIAMCLGAPVYSNHSNAIQRFAANHGRNFPAQNVDRAKSGRVGGKIASVLAVRRSGKGEVSHAEAFDLFPLKHEPNPFASLSQHEFEA